MKILEKFNSSRAVLMSGVASVVGSCVGAFAVGEPVIDITTTFTPIMTSVVAQIVSFITAMIPFIIGVSLLGGGIMIVKKMISTGTKTIG